MLYKPHKFDSLDESGQADRERLLAAKIDNLGVNNNPTQSLKSTYLYLSKCVYVNSPRD